MIEKDLPIISKRLDETIAELIKQGVVFYGSGMAIGFDTLAAKAVIKARLLNPAVRLIAVLPCHDQDARWNDSQKQEYKRLLSAADKVVCVSEQPYYDGCMEKRNLHLIKHSGVCVAYLLNGNSGTSQTVCFARENGLKVINLAIE